MQLPLTTLIVLMLTIQIMAQQRSTISCYMCLSACPAVPSDATQACGDTDNGNATGLDFLKKIIGFDSTTYETLNTQLQTDFPDSNTTFTDLTQYTCVTNKDKTRYCLRMPKGFCDTKSKGFWQGLLGNAIGKVTGLFNQVKSVLWKNSPLNNTLQYNITSWLTDNYFEKLKNADNGVENCCEGSLCNNGYTLKLTINVIIGSILIFLFSTYSMIKSTN